MVVSQALSRELTAGDGLEWLSDFDHPCQGINNIGQGCDIQKLRDAQLECEGLLSNKYLCQVTLIKFKTNSNTFDLSQTEAITSYFSLSWSISISLYLGLCRACRAVKINYQVSIIKFQVSIIKYQSSIIKDQGSRSRREFFFTIWNLFLSIFFHSSDSQRSSRS